MNMISISKGLHTNSTMPTLQSKLGKHQHSTGIVIMISKERERERERKRETFLPVKEIRDEIQAYYRSSYV